MNPEPMQRAMRALVSFLDSAHAGNAPASSLKSALSPFSPTNPPGISSYVNIVGGWVQEAPQGGRRIPAEFSREGTRRL